MVNSIDSEGVGRGPIQEVTEENHKYLIQNILAEIRSWYVISL